MGMYGKKQLLMNCFINGLEIYVTAESWSNITVNESFANYSEYLWDEYKHGKDHADAHQL